MGAGTGAAATALASLLLGSKGMRRLAESTLELGGAAALGGLAYKAYQSWQNGAAPSNMPASDANRSALAKPSILLLALVNAAKADRHIDDREQARIDAELDRMDLDAQTSHLVKDAVHAPLDVQRLARRATTPEPAAEIHTVSCAVLDRNNQRDQAYLELLASELCLARIAHTPSSRGRGNTGALGRTQ